ncbi:MAG: hypothetical protein HYX65_03265 [Gemmatimonadetes bacterium]|nr:hypothetical protein [Gemmatimonadota bacterium]
MLDGQRLRAVTAGAAGRRVRAGMTVAEARARCAGLEVVAWDPVAIGNEIVRVTAAFVRASPQVSPVPGAPGTWWVGATGFDGIGGEAALVRALLAIAQRWHPRARVAVASSCVAARAATWGDVGDGVRRGVATRVGTDGAIVQAGACAAYLAPAPLSLVPMDDELREALGALGLTSAGALAALAADDVEARWGDGGLAAWRLARGEDLRRPTLVRSERPREVHAELPTSTATMEPVLFLVRAALDRLVEQLLADARAAAAIAITLTLDDARTALPTGSHQRAHTVTREVRLPRALARVAPLFERCRALLDSWALGAPVNAVTVAVVATTAAQGEQGGLLDSAWRDPGAATAAMERLRAELGAGAVVRAAERDTHRPERAAAWVEATMEEGGHLERSGPEAREVERSHEGRLPGTRAHGIPPLRATEPRSGRDDDEPHKQILRFVQDDKTDGTAALRMLAPPAAVTVECAAGAPHTLWWQGRRVVLARVQGPERLGGEWWTDPWQRDYWRGEGALDGDAPAELVLYRERLADAAAGSWYLQGWYD